MNLMTEQTQSITSLNYPSHPSLSITSQAISTEAIATKLDQSLLLLAVAHPLHSQLQFLSIWQEIYKLCSNNCIKLNHYNSSPYLINIPKSGNIHQLSLIIHWQNYVAKTRKSCRSLPTQEYHSGVHLEAPCKYVPCVGQWYSHQRSIHSYYTNNAALDYLIQKISFCIYLDHLGMQLGMTLQTQGSLKDWTDHFFGHWFNTNWLQILSFHKSQGIVINNATANNPQVLKPVADGPFADCHLADVAFAQVCHTYHFNKLDPKEPISPLHLEYFIQLPQATFVGML